MEKANGFNSFNDIIKALRITQITDSLFEQIIGQHVENLDRQFLNLDHIQKFMTKEKIDPEKNSITDIRRYRHYCYKTHPDKSSKYIVVNGVITAVSDDDYVQHLISCSGIPLEYEGKNLDNYNPMHESQKQAIEYCRKYAVGFKPGTKEGIFLVGKSGRGKTHLLTGVMTELIRLGKVSKPLFVSFSEFLDRLKANMRTVSYDQELHKVKVSPDLLFVDDIGKDGLTEYGLGILYDLLEARKAKKPTLASSNLSKLEFLQACPGPGMADKVEAIFSRLNGSSKVLLIQGPDYNETVKQQSFDV